MYLENVGWNLNILIMSCVLGQTARNKASLCFFVFFKELYYDEFYLFY